MSARWKNVLTSTGFTILVPHAAYAAWTPPATGVVYAIIAVVLVMTVVALAAVAQKLAATTTWSLADALSEETDLTVSDANNLPYTVNGVVVKKTELRASSSRLIAFLGMIAILVMFIGFGVFILWGFATAGELPEGAGGVLQYLLGGMTLFAPYVVNKFASMFAAR